MNTDLIFSTSYPSVNNFFSTPDTVFVVPTFQRPYAWEEKHIQDLLNDLEMGSRRNPPRHYLSPIHLVPIESSSDPVWENYTDNSNDDIKHLTASAFYGDDNEGNPENPLKVYLIIDGQQRLTTLFSLFWQIPAFRGNLSLNVGKNIIPKLILNPVNDHYRLRQLIGFPSPKPAYKSHAQVLLENCFNAATTITSNPHTVRFLRGNVQILVVALNPSYGLQAFQTQNDRGKYLTILEKLKSLFMEHDLNYCACMCAKDIHSTFGKLYRVLDKGISVGIFDKGEAGDNQLIQLISVYLRIVNEPDIYWHSADKVYDFFRDKLKEAVPADVTSLLNDWLRVIDELIGQLDHLIGYLSKGGHLTVSTSSKIDPSRTIGDDYQVILKSLTLSNRSLALLLKFRAMFGKEWHDRVPVTIAVDNSNIVKAAKDSLTKIKGRLHGLPDNPLINVKISDIENRLSQLQEVTHRNIELSPLEVVEKIELLVLKQWNPKAGFSGNWKSVFDAPAPDIVTALITWNHCLRYKEKFFNELLNYAGQSGIYKYILMENDSYNHHRLNHFNGNLEFEHIFPQNPDPKPPVVYGFPDLQSYQFFIEKLENRNFLDGGLNKRISNRLPDLKAMPYKTQSDGTYTVPLPDQVQSAIDIGNDFLAIPATHPELYKIYLELRGIELALFAFERFF